VRSAEYIDSQLFCNANEKNHYLTIDRWKSATAFKAFRSQWQNEYEALDQRCETLTEREVFIGSFNQT
jgi:hypothetical protein